MGKGRAVFKWSERQRSRGGTGRQLAVWLTVWAAVGCGGAQAGRPIELAANEWQPYTGSDVPKQGVATQIVRTALQRAGYAVTVRFSNWPRALHSTYQGGVDGLVAVWSTSLRSERLLFSEKYLENRIAVVGMTQRFVRVQRLGELRGLKVGIGRDYDYSEEFLSETGIVTQPVDHALQNLLKLTLGRIDAAIEDRLIIQYNIVRHSAEHPQLRTVILSNSDVLVLPIRLGIRKDLPDAEAIVRDFDRALSDMRRDGTLKAILKEWHIVP